MKTFFIQTVLAFSTIFILSACSSGGGNNGAGTPTTPVVTEFSQALAGTWVSECLPSPEGNFKETLNLTNDHNGTSFRTIYPNVSCAGTDTGVTQPQSFIYQEGVTANNLTPVTLTFPGQGSTTVQISIFNRTMDVIDAQGQRARYTRINTGNSVPGQNPAQDLNDFDSLAIGTWALQACDAGPSANTSVKEVLTIQGGGRAESVYKSYQNLNCSGQGRIIDQQSFTYAITRFANAAGQINVNNQLIEVRFQTNTLTMTSAQRSATYVRVQSSPFDLRK